MTRLRARVDSFLDAGEDPGSEGTGFSKSVERRFGRADYLLKTAQGVVEELPEPGQSAP